MKYYSVYTSYDDFIPIDETELPKAMQAFITESPVVFKEGATRRIDKIIPDYARMMGWNKGYKLSAEDWAEVNTDRTCKEAREALPLLMEEVKMQIGGNNFKKLS